eukprot:TRINITY_DN7087_c0_g1_i1.p1 TRINITY_DN7087_c0_g1~~TRINITY_DN7087_c0_g1_i1.p1  ORF type:complete len:419 (+),score=96.50 TRINITY_DN7087_c0_g1_i1:66-1322(+)
MEGAGLAARGAAVDPTVFSSPPLCLREGGEGEREAPSVAPPRGSGVRNDGVVDASSKMSKTIASDELSACTLQTLYVVGKQFLAQQGSTGWTDLYFVMERVGRAGLLYQGSIFNCRALQKTEQQRQAFISDLWKRSKPRDEAGGGEAMVVAARRDPSSSPADTEDDIGDIDVAAILAATIGSDNDGPDARAKVDMPYPELELNGREAIILTATRVLGSTTLMEAEKQCLLSSCGLRDSRQITFKMCKFLYARGSRVLKEQHKGAQTSWAQMFPVELLYNTWGTQPTSISASGEHFYPPDHCKAKKHGGIEHKRLALRIAAQVFPFWRTVVVTYFKDHPVAAASASKRFRGLVDAFAKAGGKTTPKKPRLRLSADKLSGTDAEKRALTMSAVQRAEKTGADGGPAYKSAALGVVKVGAG